jgi:hypothetical protein
VLNSDPIERAFPKCIFKVRRGCFKMNLLLGSDAAMGIVFIGAAMVGG